MKRIVTLFAALVCALAAFAQTPEEILARMEEEINKHEQEGTIMGLDIKIPILGTMSSKTWMLGDKMYIESKVMGKEAFIWSDGTTQWTYIPSNNEIEIEDDTPSSSKQEGDMEMLAGITDGYDVSIKKETAEAWYIQCKKSKDNKEKDDPKKMDVVVSKSTYYPISLSAKMKGVSVTLRDIDFGVKEEKITFDINKYPGVKITDKRGQSEGKK
jgi:outer membrane lipoprotein-sorting protein